MLIYLEMKPDFEKCLLLVKEALKRRNDNMTPSWMELYGKLLYETNKADLYPEVLFKIKNIISNSWTASGAFEDPSKRGLGKSNYHEQVIEAYGRMLCDPKVWPFISDNIHKGRIHFDMSKRC